EICNQHLRKGQQVYVEGRLQTRRWEDAEGNKHYTTELVAKEMIILGDKRETFIAEDLDEADEGEELPF
ncbi:MAG: single-stranded DNA-binding protein, partial [Anaerolineales bacterium]|nr:single-stranded DNA-binding protein [Anaerolineales bacterium]